MAARIFISYRSADGTDKATALARDLGARFGDDQVFLDKDDLRGGSLWRREVASAIEQRPVLLLLVTPQLFGALDAAGRRRIDQADDPVRREVEAALAQGADLIPVLCDGVDAAPDLAGLPPPFDRLGERTWRKLRAHDWAKDVRRLVDDLQAFGIPAARSPARRLWLAGAAVGAGALATWAWRGRRPAGPIGPAGPAGLNGAWQAQFDGESVTVELHHTGEQLQLESHPIDVGSRPDWAKYREFWLRRERSELEQVRYRGEGTARMPAGSPLTVDLAFKVVSVPGDVHIDGGNLTATLSPDGRELRGTRWLNSAQAVTPVVLTRLE